MARATTKADLTASANGQFDKMWKLINSMSEERQKATFADEMATAGKETHWSRDKNLRDVLVHLYEWHQLLLDWVQANLDGENRTFLPEPYNWNLPGNERRVLEEASKHAIDRSNGELKRESQRGNDADRAILQ